MKFKKVICGVVAVDSQCKPGVLKKVIRSLPIYFSRCERLLVNTNPFVPTAPTLFWPNNTVNPGK